MSMKCPYKKVVTEKKGRDNSIIRTEEFAPCDHYDCPYFTGYDMFNREKSCRKIAFEFKEMEKHNP